MWFSFLFWGFFFVVVLGFLGGFLAASRLSCNTQDLHCGAQGSSLRDTGFSLVETHKLSSCGARG